MDLDKNAPETEVIGFDAALAKALCTDEEREFVLDGDDAYLILEVNPADDTVTEAEKALAEELAEKTAKGAVVGEYIDISLFRKVGDRARVAIHDTLGKMIHIKTRIPANLLNTDSSKERTFYIIRIHDGKATLLATTKDDYAEFESDLFSTYAIAYSDSDIKTADNGNSGNTGSAGSSGNSGNSGSSGKSSGVRTGDTTKLYVWAGLLAAAVIFLIIAVARRRREDQE